MKTKKLLFAFKALLLSLLLCSSSYPLHAQSWMKVLGTRSGDDELYNLKTLPDGKLYLQGDFRGSDSFKSSDPAEGNLFKGSSRSTGTDFILQMNSSGKILDKFVYYGYSGDIVAGDKQGDFMMTGICDSVELPGDTFNASPTYLPLAANVIEQVAFELFDSSAKVKWHYITQYIHSNDIGGYPFPFPTHADSLGNWYILMSATITLIEKDTMWNDKSTDSDLVLLKIDANGKYVSHKRIQTPKMYDVDANGNILLFVDGDGFSPNSIIYKDMSGNLKWKKPFYQLNGSGILNAMFSSSGNIFVIAKPKTGVDSIYEFNPDGTLIAQDPGGGNYGASDLFLLAHPSGEFIYTQTNDLHLGRSEIQYAYDGIYANEYVSYYTDSFIAGINVNAVLGSQGELYFPWILYSGINTKPNILHTKYRTVQGFGGSDIVIGHLSPDTMYLGVEKEIPIEKSLAIYPNPAANSISVRLPQNVVGSKIEVYDMLGKTVEFYSSSLNNTWVDITALNAGMYTVKVQDKAGNSFFGKFIKTAQ